MTNWPEDINRALAYMEAHLTEDLSVQDVAAQAYVSPFHFQRMFSALCGMGAGEYMRSRRLTLAGQALRRPGARVIDVALQYGYDTPESFCRAFKRFHGVVPSAARRKSTPLRSLAPITIRPPQEGYAMLEYRIIEKPQFTVAGVLRRFHPDTSVQAIPAFWDEVMALPAPPVQGTYGVCLDEESADGTFAYMIADDACTDGTPPELVQRVIPACTWAVFPCRGRLPECLQTVNQKIWAEWLPAQRDYRLAASMNIELYTPADNNGDTYCEIWLPIAPNP